MKTKFLILVGVTAGVLSLNSCATAPGHDLALGGEKDIALSDVPPVVMKAALAARPDFVAESAELEKDEAGQVVYELDGRSGGMPYEIEITPEGRAVEVEAEK